MWTHVSILCVNLWNKKLSQFTGLVKAAEELSVVLKRDLKRAVILEVCCCKVLSLALYQVNTNLLCHLTLKKETQKTVLTTYMNRSRCQEVPPPFLLRPPMSRSRSMSACKDRTETDAKWTEFGMMVHKLRFAFGVYALTNRRVKSVFCSANTTAEQYYPHTYIL